MNSRTWQPFLWDVRYRPPRATNPGDEPGERACPPLAEKACRPYSVLLPVGFAVPSALPRPRCALTAPFHPDLAKDGPCKAVCSLWHCPWGRPRRRLSGTASPWSPDFPPRLTTERLPGRLIRGTDCAAGGAGSRLGGHFSSEERAYICDPKAALNSESRLLGSLGRHREREGFRPAHASPDR